MIPQKIDGPLEKRQVMYVPLDVDLRFAAPEIENVEIPSFEKISDITGKKIRVGLPLDAQLVHIMPHPAYGCWMVLVAHSGYPEVPFGKAIPVSPLIGVDRTKR